MIFNEISSRKYQVFIFLYFSLAEAVGMEGNLEKSKKLFMEADEIFKVVLGVEYPFYQQQIFRRYAEISKMSRKFIKY